MTVELRMRSSCKSIISGGSKPKEDLKPGNACFLSPLASVWINSYLYSLFCFVLTSTLTPAPRQETYWFLIYSGDNVNTHSPKIFTAFTSSNSQYACWGQVQASLSFLQAAPVNEGHSPDFTKC